MPVALIIGVGTVVGQASAETFAAAGYKVAIASRTQRLDPVKFPFFQFDAAEPTQVPVLFEKVHKEVGVPDVVIYNAYASGPVDRSKSSDGPAVFDFDSGTVEDYQRRMNVNAISPSVVSQQAVKGFLKLEAEGKLGPGGATYLFTGNLLNDKPLPGFFGLGTGKITSAWAVEYLARTAHNDKPFSFYYVDERQPDGQPMWKGVNGPAHADVFLQLAKDPKQGPWQYTFSKEKGYAAFPKDVVVFPRPA